MYNGKKETATSDRSLSRNLISMLFLLAYLTSRLPEFGLSLSVRESSILDNDVTAYGLKREIFCSSSSSFPRLSDNKMPYMVNKAKTHERT